MRAGPCGRSHRPRPRIGAAASAGDYARMVLHAPDATAGQREIAGYYLIDAEILPNN
ncbi:hypothetical protein MAHJHV55_52780 [Mycobacterium avium subsp. hominissuis]